MDITHTSCCYSEGNDSKMSTTQTEDEVPEFVYKPLHAADSHIRLITIIDFDDTRPIPIHCKLTTWPISEAPKYQAISYTWGDKNSLATILMNSNRMQVSQNCEYTLKQATWYGGDFRRRYYWVDAICINQSSNEEKGPQVGLMGRVYTNAERVLACVGECNAESRYLYRRLRRDSGYYRDLGDLRDGDEKRVLSLLEFGPESAERIFYALARFLIRPYFWRLWVYQELFLARQVIVCCGKQNISARVLRGLVLSVSSLRSDWDDGTIIQLIRYLIPIPSLLLEVGVFNPVPTTLSTALGYVRGLKCTDPIDRIYGVLSTINWSNNDPIRPDYTKDRLEIAIEALEIVEEEDFDNTNRLRMVEQIVGILNLSGHPSPRLREAIQARRLEPPTQLAKSSPRSCRKFYHFKGRCLAYEDEKWTLEGFAIPRHWAPISIQQQSGYVRPPSLKPDILLPPVTRPGDWCITNNENKNLILIARPRLDGHLDIVGKALFHHGHAGYLFQGFDFTVRFGNEDLMVFLSSQAHSFDLPDPPDDKIAEYLETRVCGQPGSSYAIKWQWPPRRPTQIVVQDGSYYDWVYPN